jgi:hypothetical protein
VVTVANTVRTGLRLNTLNSDGQRHPLVNILTVCTLVVGLASFVLGMFVRNVPSLAGAWHIVATGTGLASMVVGLYVQLISATREQAAHRSPLPR